MQTVSCHRDTQERRNYAPALFVQGELHYPEGAQGYMGFRFKNMPGAIVLHRAGSPLGVCLGNRSLAMEAAMKKTFKAKAMDTAGGHWLEIELTKPLRLGL